MSWLSAVPHHLLERAYRAQNEYAWSRSDAIEVAETLKARHFRVIGVDVWLPTTPGPTIPTPYVYDWNLSSDYASPEYPRTAIDFIQTFEWSEDDSNHRALEPYFNLTVVAIEA